MAYAAGARPDRRDVVAGGAERAGDVPPGPVHPQRARGDGASVGGGAAPARGASVRGGREANGSVDDDGDARGAVAPPRPRGLRRGAVPAGAEAGAGAEAEAEATFDVVARQTRLRIAIPAKGRLREPSVELLEDAGLGPE